ncbi:zinc-binding metallopeptidase family protein [Helcococcus bovis]|uniref:hypothetical protein n=1 Tax=Helcococcus bovis TaxID=3153252 RepID=UPI0038B89A51
MKKKLFDEIDRLKYSMINDLLKLISIPSKRGVSTDDAPYGLEAKNILLKARDILNREGFETKLVDNKLVYGNYGESKEYIGIFGHLDVVDEGDLTKWSSNPYMGDIRNNKIYGRGFIR